MSNFNSTNVKTNRTLQFKTLFFLTIFLFSSASFAGSAIQHSVQASKHAVISSGHLVAGTVKGVAHVVALPLIAIGSVGAASAAAGSAIIDKTKAYQPLDISEDNITTDPAPNIAAN